MAGLSKISNHSLVSLKVSASQRLLGRPKVKKDPVTTKMLKALVKSKITDKSTCISDRLLMSYRLRGFVVVVVVFFFFRFSELSHIKACDINFFPSYASIFLESSKTDQFRDGAWIFIARPDLPTWKNTSQLRRSTSPKICFSSGPLLLFGRKRWSEAKGLALPELANRAQSS